jgi:hypothetical protein
VPPILYMGKNGQPAPRIPAGTGSAPASTTAAQTPANVLNPQAVRASGPSQGYDPQYLQNLATAIGGLFSPNQQSGSNTTNINPLGTLGEISPSSGIGGNAPTQGLPLTWLQQALAGQGFSSPAASTPATTTTPTVTNTRPQVPNIYGSVSSL